MQQSKLFEEILALESPVNVKFKKQLELIGNSEKRSKVENILRTISTRNIKEPASSTGKYHPKFAHEEYGLSKHVKAVVAFASDICESFPELNKDSLIIAALMHDIIKYKGENAHTSKTHAKDAYELLKENGLEDEARLVYSHMGRWSKSDPHPEKFDEKMFHLADYLASRTYISIDFDEDDNIITSNDDPRRTSNRLPQAEAKAASMEYERDFLLGKNEGF
jgi:putative nucleotidyltransferase with HDIG domain